MQKFRRTKAVAQGSVVALAVAALVFGLATLILPKHSPKLLLASGSGSGFTITSSISSSDTSQTPTSLIPGMQDYLWFTAHNSLKVPITVNSMSITAVSPPAGCSSSNLEYTAFSGSLVVSALGTDSVPEPISLDKDSPSSCENVTFGLTYAGTAIYTEVYATSTSLVSSENPASINQQVTYTATVTATATASQDAVPNSPTGTLTFKDGSNTICTAVAVTSTGTTTATAICQQTYTSTSGSPHSITAVYSNTDGNFSGSTSSPLSQVVQSATHNSTTTALTSTPNPSDVGNSVALTATVTKSSGSGTPTGTVNFYSGTPTGTHSSLGSGTLSSDKATFNTTSLPSGTDNLYAVYGGDSNFTTSTSPVISQVVITPKSTTTALVAAPNPTTVGNSVTMTATVTKSSGTATPTGTMSFYSGTPTGTHTLLGTGTLNSSAKATFSTSSLPVGTNSLYAVYGGDINYSASTSPVISEVVNLNATTTALSSAPNPSGRGGSVTLTGTVNKSSGSATPTGTVSFYSGTPTGTHSLLGTGSLNTSAQATLTSSTLPVGTDSLYAVYGGDGNFSGSTSPVLTQVVIGPPASCNGSYSNTFIGTPGSPFINGTNGNDFIYAFGWSYFVNGLGGNDCLDAGDGNNVLTEGDGNDVVLAGNGNNLISLGNGNDKVVVGNGSSGIEAGNGTDSVTLGNGSDNGVLVGNGTDTVTVGNGSYNDVTLGSGTDTVTIQGGSHDNIDGGNGNETIYLGAGTYNDFSGAAHRTNICHLPTPPPSWHGTAASYYHDTITNCTVVTP